jgi:hypothetical protein
LDPDPKLGGKWDPDPKKIVTDPSTTLHLISRIVAEIFIKCV